MTTATRSRQERRRTLAHADSEDEANAIRAELAGTISFGSIGVQAPNTCNGHRRWQISHRWDEPTAPKPQQFQVTTPEDFNYQGWINGFRDDSNDPGARPFINRRHAREQRSKQREEMEALGLIGLGLPLEYKGSHVKLREVAQAVMLQYLRLEAGEEPWPVVWNAVHPPEFVAASAKIGVEVINVAEYLRRVETPDHFQGNLGANVAAL